MGSGVRLPGSNPGSTSSCLKNLGYNPIIPMPVSFPVVLPPLSKDLRKENWRSKYTQRTWSSPRGLLMLALLPRVAAHRGRASLSTAALQGLEHALNTRESPKFVTSVASASSADVQ